MDRVMQEIHAKGFDKQTVKQEPSAMEILKQKNLNHFLKNIKMRKDF